MVLLKPSSNACGLLETHARGLTSNTISFSVIDGGHSYLLYHCTCISKVAFGTFPFRSLPSLSSKNPSYKSRMSDSHEFRAPHKDCKTSNRIKLVFTWCAELMGIGHPGLI